MMLRSDLYKKFLTNIFIKERKFFNIMYDDRDALIIKIHKN